jgi:hypothetical protein
MECSLFSWLLLELRPPLVVNTMVVVGVRQERRLAVKKGEVDLSRSNFLSAKSRV